MLVLVLENLAISANRDSQKLAGPADDRGGRSVLQPVRPALAEEHVQIGEVAAHLKREDRKR